MSLQAYLDEKTALVNAFLDRRLPNERQYPEPLYQAMRYSVFAGGKRLRPVLTIAGFETVNPEGAASEWLLAAASALELIHTYSLIHDDLPAMDNDDFRRGKPTNHKVFGEAIAILAGDALLTMAFDLIARPGEPEGRTPRGHHRRLLRVIQEISQAAGFGGMIGGQAADILSTGKTKDPQALEYIHRHKTAALIRTAVRVGGILGGASETELRALTAYGERIGLAFQIVDDILDVEGTTEELGKTIQSDQSRGKNTYPEVYGLAESKRKARTLVEGAIRSLERFGTRADILCEIAHYIVERRK